jgi:hypothetical protein
MLAGILDALGQGRVPQVGGLGLAHHNGGRHDDGAVVLDSDEVAAVARDPRQARALAIVELGAGGCFGC